MPITAKLVIAATIAGVCAVLAHGALIPVALAQGALAQGAPPQGAPAQGGYSPAGQNPNPVCARLEAQLAAVDRGAGDPNQAAQQRRSEDAVNKQQADLDRVVAQSRRLGCEGAGIFSLFIAQNPQCGPLNGQIQQLRTNLDRALSDLQTAQGNGAAGRDNQRQTLIATLAQNNCGPQYRAAVNPPRGLMDTLFGSNNGSNASWGTGDGSTYKTLCVRTCDGYYFPISFAANPSKFNDDAQVCQRACPAAEAVLYTHRNPGESINEAVSLNGRPYTELPAAFKYRTEFNNACSCRRAGQSWADALGSAKDDALEQGDIVVTAERAKAMSLPQQQRGQQGRKTDPKSDPKADPKNAAAQPLSAAPPVTADSTTPPSTDAKKTIRTVGPTYLPTR